ncbi:MAG: hypothetical protein ACFCVA_09650 [Gammaproteobacteria bacterium]
MNEITQSSTREAKPPVRGSLRLTVSTSSPQVIAGSDFSIFVTIQNPFDTPITIYQAQTHIPVELIDVNGMRIRRTQMQEVGDAPWHLKLRHAIARRLEQRSNHTGIAIAVGTDFEPKSQQEFANITTNVQTLGAGASVVGIQFSFPQNPSTEELDQLFRRLVDYRKGLVPVCLQPGDSVVKQFVLHTRHWLFFTPLTHQFQIQVNYSIDGVDHADTIAHQQIIRPSMKATVIGGISGAIVGTLLKSLSGGTTPSALAIAMAALASVLAAIAVVVAFARKAGVQPVVSVEDFWGGAFIGFSTGFFGFERFSTIFAPSGS